MRGEAGRWKSLVIVDLYGQRALVVFVLEIPRRQFGRVGLTGAQVRPDSRVEPPTSNPAC